MGHQQKADQSIVTFAQRVLDLLDRGAFVSTYKYAVLLGLMDLCLEKTSQKGEPPESVTTYQLAEKVIQLYWPHSRNYLKTTQLLRQNTLGQAKILTEISLFRKSLSDPSNLLFRARASNPAGYEKLLRKVEWILIYMPLPKLQTVGRTPEKLLYEIAWDNSIEKNKKRVSAYQRGNTGGFDNRIKFVEGVSQNLVILNGLLRPLIHREWARMVARINDEIFSDQNNIEEFLFGAERVSLQTITTPLRDAQNNRCFYCDNSMPHKNIEIDHFIPWARYPDNGIHNLVAAHRKANNAKRDFLASKDHLLHWTERNEVDSQSEKSLVSIAEHKRWENHPDYTA
ncbi:hypothetical protein KAI87_14025, partial [Myxococcota bacterium]|nr:hypothetical protein [Myxococcota bacterium]